jgi:hypothetical protein
MLWSVKTVARPRQNDSDPRLFDKTRATAYGRAAIREARQRRFTARCSTIAEVEAHLESCLKKSK